MKTSESVPSFAQAEQRAYNYYISLLFKGELKSEDVAQYNHLREKERAGEIQRSPEYRAVTDDEAVSTLVAAKDGFESSARFDLWLDQIQEEADKTPGNLTRIECAIRRASVYYRAGFVEKAVNDLVETQEAASFEPDRSLGLEQRISSLLESIRRGQSI